MQDRLKKLIIRSLTGTARAGLAAAASGGGASPKRRRKRVKGGEERCTPCEAYGAVGDAYERVRNGSL